MHRILRPGFGLLAFAITASAPTLAANVEVLDTPQSISSMASRDADVAPHSNFDGLTPAVATDPLSKRALVVWSGDSSRQSIPVEEDEESRDLADNEYEIFGKLYNHALFFIDNPQTRYSIMGSDATTDSEARAAFDALNPAVAWNPVANEFLVVWEGDDDTAPLVDDEFEIFGLRVDTEGEVIGEKFRISKMGNDAATQAAERQRYGAHKPAVAVNTLTGSYLVVWHGDDDTGSTVDDELEIFGQLLDEEGTLIGASLRISSMGPDANAAFNGTNAAVAYNPVTDGFIVAWQGDDNSGTTVDNEFEIFVRQLDGSAAPLATQFRVSEMGGDGDSAYDAFSPAVAVNSDSGDALVAWHGDTSSGGLVNDEFEIHARLVPSNGTTPLPTGFRVSSMGLDNETDAAVRVRYRADSATVAWDPQEQQFLVGWRGDDVDDPLIDDEFEIFTRLVNADGSTSLAAVRVSEQGDDEEEDPEERVKFSANEPAIAWGAGSYFIVWSGDNDSRGNNDFEITGTRAASVFTTLKLTAIEADISVSAPNPVTATLSFLNEGDHAATNLRVLFERDPAWPMTLNGCADVPEEGVCVIGDLLPDEAAEVELVLETDHLGLEDELRSEVNISVDTDTALKSPDAARSTFSAGASVTVEGGSGALGWLLLFGPLVAVGRRRGR